MRIRGLDITAYGPLVDRHFDVGNGLTVFFGRNEAGKTTLKRFVETMLFGFDDDDVDQFLPWQAEGRDFGGALRYELGTGQAFLIRRYYDVSGKRTRKSDRERASLLRGKDGTGGEADLDVDKIGEVHLQQRRAIFRTVFSIDLGALVALNELDHGQREEMTRVFFRELATAGEVANPREVEKDLRERAERICKYAGSRKQTDVDKFKQQELRQAKAGLDEAQRIADEVEGLEEAIAKVQTQRTGLMAERSRLQTALSRQQSVGPAAEAHRRLAEAEAALAELLREPKIDEAAVRRLADVLSARPAQAKLAEQLREDRDAAEAQLAKLREQLTSLPDVEARADVIEQLAGACGLHEDLSKRLAGEEADARLRREQLTQELSDLVTGEDPLASRALQMTSTRRNELVAQIDRYEVHLEEANGRRRRLDEDSERLAELTSQIDRVARDVPDDFPADYRPEQLRELLAIERELTTVEDMRRRMEERRQQLKEDRRHLDATRKETAARQGTLRAAVPTSRWVVWGVALAAGLIGVAYGGFVGQYDWAGAGAVLSALAVWTLVGYWQRRQEALQAGELVAASPLLQSLTARIKDAEDAVAREEPLLEAGERGLASRYKGAGLGDKPDAVALGAAIDRLRRFDDCLGGYRELSRLRDERDRLKSKVDGLRTDVDGDTARLEDERGEIVKALSEIDLAVPTDGTPRQLRDRLGLAGQLADRVVECKRLEDAVARRREQVERYVGEVAALAASVSGPDRASSGAAGQGEAPASDVAGPDPADRPYAYVRYVADLLSRARALRERLPEREREVKTAAERSQQAEERLAEIDRNVGDLLVRLGLDKADELPALEAKAKHQAEQRSSLEATVRSRRDQLKDLTRAAGLPDDWVPDAHAASEADREQTGETSDQLNARIADIEQEIDHVTQEIYRLEEELAQKRSATPVAVAEGAYEDCLDRLAETYEQFDALLVAHRLLERAMQRYRQQRQPAIVRAAQDYLKELTAGRYDRLQTDLLDSSQRLGEIWLVPPAGQPREATYFSRGAREQLYLSLRLALADELSRGEPLPLVLDDVLVNFDGPRFEATAQLLARMGGTRQILFLTCHDDARKAFAKRGASICEL